MIKVIFKNVDQGDSIILEWENDAGETKIGIIDSNLIPSNANPVLDHIIRSESKEIEFLILSHPHLDHYSGFYQVLNYCEANAIHVKYFLHTSMQVPEYLQTSVKSVHATNELKKLFLKVRDLTRSGIIKTHGYVTDNSKEIELNNHIRLKFLSPSPLECDNYVSHVPLYHEEDGNNNPNANWLSTFIKVYSDNWFILLTADVDKTVLLRLGTKHSDEFSKTLLLAQSPHHGASLNHRNSFWKTGITNRRTNTPIVFSVGNNIYRHPSEEAVKFFHNHDYSIFSTNQVGCLNTIDDETVHRKSTALDSSSFTLYSKVPSRKLNGDKVFIIKKDKIDIVE